LIKVVAFDLDDTLWYVDPVIIRAEGILRDWFRVHVTGFEYDSRNMGQFREQVLTQQPELAGRLTDFRYRVIETALTSHGVPDAPRIASEAMQVFLTARNQVEFFEGAIDAIADLAGQYQLGALTNGNADIHRLGLGQYFTFAFSAEDVGAPKPAPDLFHEALSHTGVEATEMVYVGDDRIKDIDAANAVGLKTIWLRNERRSHAAESEPDAVIEDISELPKTVRLIENRE